MEDGDDYGIPRNTSTAEIIVVILLLVALTSGGWWAIGDRIKNADEATKPLPPPKCQNEVVIICEKTFSPADRCKEWNLNQYKVTKLSSGTYRIESRTVLTEKYTIENYMLRSVDVVCTDTIAVH